MTNDTFGIDLFDPYRVGVVFPPVITKSSSSMKTVNDGKMATKNFNSSREVKTPQHWCASGADDL
jgi:hypothetical protein